MPANPPLADADVDVVVVAAAAAGAAVRHARGRFTTTTAIVLSPQSSSLSSPTLGLLLLLLVVSKAPPGAAAPVVVVVAVMVAAVGVVEARGCTLSDAGCDVAAAADSVCTSSRVTSHVCEASTSCSSAARDRLRECAFADDLLLWRCLRREPLPRLLVTRTSAALCSGCVGAAGGCVAVSVAAVSVVVMLVGIKKVDPAPAMYAASCLDADEAEDRETEDEDDECLVWRRFFLVGCPLMPS